MKFVSAVAGVFLCLIISGTPIFANAEDRHGEGEGKNRDASLVKLDPFILNVGDTKDTRFVKLVVCLDLSAPTLAERVKTRNGAIRDAVIMIVTSKTAQDIMYAEGRLQLKDALLERINRVMGDKAVKNIYFTDVIVQ